MKKEKFKYVILGAGPTGLGAAHRLKELGVDDFIVIEKDSHVGGLAKSETDHKGFTWDIGGHVHFSTFSYYTQMLESLLRPNEWNHHQRESWIWMDNRFIPYPLQRNIHFLSEDQMQFCLNGLQRRKTIPSKQNLNFSDWGLQSMGQGIYDLFFEPYNKKVWGFELHQLNSSWIKERVATISLSEIEDSIRLKRQDANWGPNSKFRYPKRGGSGAIWQRLADKIGVEKIRLNSKVDKIEFKEKKISTNECQYQYQYLITSVPLSLAMNMMVDLPETVKKFQSEFKYSTTLVVGLGFKGDTPPALAGRNWIYFPEKQFPFFRGTLLSSYSSEMVPLNISAWSFLLESTIMPSTSYNKDKVISDSLTALIDQKLISPDSQLTSQWFYEAKFGYPTPFLERDSVLPIVQDYLKQNQIYSRGRFGGWKYEVSNQDHSFMQGKEVVDHLILGDNESIYKY